MILNESGIDSDMTFYAQWEENVIETPLNPLSSETTNNSTTQIRTEEIENPETGETINIDYFIISSIVIVLVLLGFKKLKKEHV